MKRIFSVSVVIIAIISSCETKSKTDFYYSSIPKRIIMDYINKIESVLFCKAEGSYTRIFFIDGQQILVCDNLKRVEQCISDKIFIRCHNSYLVNRKYIGKLDLKNHTNLLNRLPDFTAEDFNKMIELNELIIKTLPEEL